MERHYLKYAFFIIFIDVSFCDNIPEYYQNIINEIQKSKNSIAYYEQSITKSLKFSKITKNIKNTSSYKVNKLNFEKDYNELIEKIDFLYETYDKVDKEIITILKEKIYLENKLIIEHENLIKKYNSTYIDNSFFNHTFYTSSRPQYQDGYWITYHYETGYMHNSQKLDYWLPGTQKRVFKDPFDSDVIILSTLAKNAKSVYANDWENYIETKRKKSKLFDDIIHFQKTKIKDKVNQNIVNKCAELKPFLMFLEKKLDTEKENYNLIIKKIIDSGINISEKEKSNFTLIQTRVKNFGKKIQTEYRAFIDKKNKNMFFDAAYHIFSLVAIDKKKAYEPGHEEAEKFSKKYLNQILNDFNKNIKIIERGDYKGYSISLLSQYEFFVLIGITNMSLLTNYSPSKEDQFIMPKIKFDINMLDDIFSSNKLGLALESDYLNLSKADNATIENTYYKQIGNSDLRLNNTDYHGFSGLFSGNKILCVDINGEIKVKIISLNTTDNWGIKTHNIKIEETTDISATEYLNIRIRSE